MASAEYQKAWRARNPTKTAEYYSKPGEKERYRSAKEQWRKTNPAKALYNKMKSRARQYDRECSISKDDFLALFDPLVCAATGMPLEWTQGARQPWNPSVDRIDSTKGYTLENTRVVSVLFNLAKSEWTDADVLKMAEALCQFGQQ